MVLRGLSPGDASGLPTGLLRFDEFDDPPEFDATLDEVSLVLFDVV